MKKELKEYLQKIEDLEYLNQVLSFESSTILPSSSIEYIDRLTTDIQMNIFDLKRNKQYISLINKVLKKNNLSNEEEYFIEYLKKEYERHKNVPRDFYKKHIELLNIVNNKYNEAIVNNDFEIVKPYFKKLIKDNKVLYKYQFSNCKNIYEKMLGDFEQGLSTNEIDNLFNDLKNSVMDLIKNQKNYSLPKIKKKYNDNTFLEVSKYILEYIGVDTSKCVINICSSASTSKFNSEEIRITLQNKDNIFDNLSTIVHEAGHALFEQNIKEELNSYPTYKINKTSIHEALARFYENILGRNINFWKPIYKRVKKDLKIDLTLKEFIRYFNNVCASVVRTSSDELTYTMHIIIRYEIEKELINGSLKVDNIESEWNKKYLEYLGVKSGNSKDGVLQDNHWFSSSFGYFPSYLLGTIFDGMLYSHLKSVFNIDKLLRKGKLNEITNYINDNISKYASTYNINELSNILFNKSLNTEDILKYFNNKYGR